MSKKIISLKEFILTGNFGGVTIGSSIDNIEVLLGKSEEGSDYNFDTSSVFYGNFEFFYNRLTRKIEGIQIDNLFKINEDYIEKQSIWFESDKCIINYWFFDPSKNISYSELINQLKSSHCIFKEKTPNEYSIHFKSGVYFEFDSLNQEIVDLTKQSNIHKLYLNGIRLYQTD